TEGAKFWLSVMTELKNRGVQDILVACLAKQRFSGLKGFPDAIASVYPHTEPYRVCRRVNILRDYPDDKTKLYPR
ncbi:transposase, partial [Acinetobacter baumannii]|uniref:transposase n=1 Tax=Acinetobacter baumannii TaxID=470 RepID=UPI00286FDFB4